MKIHVGLAKKFICVFGKMQQKNLNGLFGQPNISFCVNIYSQFSWGNIYKWNW